LAFIDENRIDFGVQGEGEYSTLKLCDALRKKGRIENVEGILYWENNHLVHNPRNNTITDLDSIPFPFYDNFSSVMSNGGHLREYPLLTSRGCPYRCSYCSMPKIMGSRWRYHTPVRVIRELQHAKRGYGSTLFTVVDDNFTLNVGRVENITDLLVSENINLPWTSINGIRADRVTQDLAAKMKRSGCRHVWIGIESADERVFRTVNKGESLSDIEKGINHLKSAGVRVGGFFIIGLPHSTRESDLKAIDFVRGHEIDGWWFNFVPYPQTDAWDWVQNHGKRLRESNGALQFGSDGIDPVFETDEYSRESRIETYNDIHIELKYFDRVVDPSLKQWEKWRRVLMIVRPYGIRAVLFLAVFIGKYNGRLVIDKIRRTIPFSAPISSPP
jgi:radical SAM superfamily enzyme YgiQ (UPF0313 family)